MLTVFIVIVFLVAVFSILRFEHSFNKLKLVIILVILLILVASAALWVSNGGADFSSTKNTIGSVFTYFSWIKTTGLVVFDAGSDAISKIGSIVNKNQTTTTTSKLTTDGRK